MHNQRIVFSVLGDGRGVLVNICGYSLRHQSLPLGLINAYTLIATSDDKMDDWCFIVQDAWLRLCSARSHCSGSLQAGRRYLRILPVFPPVSSIAEGFPATLSLRISNRRVMVCIQTCSWWIIDAFQTLSVESFSSLTLSEQKAVLNPLMWCY